jgi:hypothetical protein
MLLARRAPIALRTLATCALVLGAEASSCGLSIEGEVVIEGRFVEVHASARRAPCAASVLFADRWVERWSECMGGAPPRVRSYIDPALRDARCGQLVPGATSDCAMSGETFSDRWVQQHELVHAVVFATFGRAPALFEEGLAVWATTAGDERGLMRVAPSIDLEPFVESASWTRAGDVAARYLAAGQLFAYLVERFGFRAVLEAYRRMRYEDDRARIDEALQVTLGRRFDELVRDWQGAVDSARAGDGTVSLLCASARRTQGDAALLASSGACAEAITPVGVEHHVVLEDVRDAIEIRASSPTEIVVGDCATGAMLFRGRAPASMQTSATRVLVGSVTGVDVEVRRVVSSSTPRVSVFDRASMNDGRAR